MVLEKLDSDLTVCKVASVADLELSAGFDFTGRPGGEIAMACRTADTPAGTVEREDGWKGFRIRDVLDFSLIGILSRLSGILAENGIGIFAVSTYNTDYILVKSGQFDKAMQALAAAGYEVA